MNPEIEFTSRAMDLYPLQKTWVKGGTVNINSFLTAQKSATEALKTASKRQKTAGATGGLDGNKLAEKIIRAASKTTLEDSSKLPAQIDKTLTRPMEIPKEKYISKQITCTNTWNINTTNRNTKREACIKANSSINR